MYRVSQLLCMCQPINCITRYYRCFPKHSTDFETLSFPGSCWIHFITKIWKSSLQRLEKCYVVMLKSWMLYRSYIINVVQQGALGHTNMEEFLKIICAVSCFTWLIPQCDGLPRNKLKPEVVWMAEKNKSVNLKHDVCFGYMGFRVNGLKHVKIKEQRYGSSSGLYPMSGFLDLIFSGGPKKIYRTGYFTLCVIRLYWV